MRVLLTAPLVLTPLLLLACDDEPDSAAPPPAETTPPAPRVEPEVDEPDEVPAPSEVQARMHDRYDGVERMRDALIEGELEQAQAIGRTLSPVSAADIPAAAEAFRGSVRERGSAVSSADDSATATRAFGLLVEACGECHRAAEATWSWETPAEPTREDPRSHMRRHQWALDRMWEALLVSDLSRFDMGARMLAEAPLFADVAEPAGLLRTLAARVHTLAADLPPDADLRSRANIYGDLLSTCATCHRQLSAAEETSVY